MRVASTADVPLQLTVFTGGNHDAATLARSPVGVPAASICLARRMDELPAFAFLGEGDCEPGRWMGDTPFSRCARENPMQPKPHGQHVLSRIFEAWEG